MIHLSDLAVIFQKEIPCARSLMTLPQGKAVMRHPLTNQIQVANELKCLFLDQMYYLKTNEILAFLITPVSKENIQFHLND